MEITVDVESDWGGRTNTLHGIYEAVPFILDEMDKRDLTGIFFISTKHLMRYMDLALDIVNRGHVIGSHGHEHCDWRFNRGWESDFLLSKLIIRQYLDYEPELYRAPKFSVSVPHQPYSVTKNHTGLLKSMWLSNKFPSLKTILYLHPFDLIKPKTESPNLFCKLWYSRHEEARDYFIGLLDLAVPDIRTV